MPLLTADASRKWWAPDSEPKVTLDMQAIIAKVGEKVGEIVASLNGAATGSGKSDGAANGGASVSVKPGGKVSLKSVKLTDALGVGVQVAEGGEAEVCACAILRSAKSGIAAKAARACSRGVRRACSRAASESGTRSRTALRESKPWRRASS